jgi:hypothetical protein
VHADITIEHATGCSQQHMQYGAGSAAASSPATCLSLLQASQPAGSTHRGYPWQHHSTEDIDQLLHQQLLRHHSATPGQYYLFLLPSTEEQREASVTVGQHRHGWLQYHNGVSSISSKLLKAAARKVLAGSFAAKAGACHPLWCVRQGMMRAASALACSRRSLPARLYACPQSHDVLAPRRSRCILQHCCTPASSCCACPTLSRHLRCEGHSC